MTPSLSPIRKTVLALLRSQVPRVGDQGVPTEEEGGRQVPYAFLSRTDSEWVPTLADPHDMVKITYQLQCVALDNDGVDYLEQRARAALSVPLVVPGWNILNVSFIPVDGPGGVRRDEDVTPHLFFSTPQWRLWAQPDPTP